MSIGRSHEANKSTNARTTKTAARDGLVRAGLTAVAAVSPGWAAGLAEALFFTPPRPSGMPLPPGARSLELATPDGRVSLWTWGRGPAIHLVHGWGGRLDQLGAFVAPLLARGFSVAAFELPAHGRSGAGRRPAPNFGHALLAYAEDCGPVHGVIAHSLGAASVAWAVRKGLSIERACFIGPRLDPVAWIDALAHGLGLSASVQARLRTASERRIAAFGDEVRVSPADGAPVPSLLVVSDEADQDVAWSEGAAVAAAWPGAELLTTSGLGHGRVLRDPQVVARIVSFVSGVGDATGAPCKVCDACGREFADQPLAPASVCEACALEADLFMPDRRWGLVR
jgi:pimeloyl-ACP methyl ester carboxylesterase